MIMKKPPIVNRLCVVYQFQSELCDASYVGYTPRHLHQRVGEYKNMSSSTGRQDKQSTVEKILKLRSAITSSIV